MAFCELSQLIRRLLHIQRILEEHRKDARQHTFQQIQTCQRELKHFRHRTRIGLKS